VILAEAALQDAQDALRRSLFGTSDPAMWDVDLVPVDRPSAEPVTIDVSGAIETALRNRTDVNVARRNLENAQTGLDFATNQKLPALDLIASYGSTGVGGTQLVREGLGGPVTETIVGGYGDALGDVFGRDFPTWSIGVNFSYPLFGRAASGRAARARVDRDQAEAHLKRVELDATVEVRSAARSVETNFKRVQATTAARVLQERRLDAENKRFGAGMSTNFLVTQAQRDLAVAQVAELRAMADYRKSLATFERVQQTNTGITFAGSGTAAPTTAPSSTNAPSSPSGSGASPSGSTGSDPGGSPSGGSEPPSGTGNTP
jgi:outer membrane protein TolC